MQTTMQTYLKRFSSFHTTFSILLFDYASFLCHLDIVESFFRPSKKQITYLTYLTFVQTLKYDKQFHPQTDLKNSNKTLSRISLDKFLLKNLQFPRDETMNVKRCYLCNLLIFMLESSDDIILKGKNNENSLKV